MCSCSFSSTGYDYAGSTFFNDSRRGGVLRRRGYLNMELQIPLGITEALFAACLLLNGHQFHDVLFCDLSCRELGNITFDELASPSNSNGP